MPRSSDLFGVKYQRAVSKSNPLLPPAEGAAPDALPTGAGEGLAQNAVKRGALVSSAGKLK